MKNTIKISLSAESILYFPIYLLVEDPISYGLNDVKIILESKNNDKEALEALNDGFHFAICDPIYLRNHKGIRKKAIKPLIIKSALWISSLRDKEKSTYSPIKHIITHPKHTTAHNCVHVLMLRENSTKLHANKFKIDEQPEVKNISFGEEFNELNKSSNRENTIIITSDIIKLIADNLEYKGLYDLGIKQFEKNVFTALISHKILLERNDSLVEKIVKAIDSVLLSFQNIKNDEYNPIAKKLVACLSKGKEKKFFMEHYSVENIEKVLKVLHDSRIYPSQKTVNRLHEYWKNSCDIKDSTKGNDDAKQ